MKTRVISAAVLVIIVGAAATVLLSVPVYAVASTNEKIEIWALAPGGVARPYTLTVNNVGSVPVTIATIEVDNVSYVFSSIATPGTFSATSNRIATGQSTTFTITTTPNQTDLPATATVNFTAVTTNGANTSTSSVERRLL